MRKLRIETIEVEGYYFPSVQNLYWHSGHFWMNDNQLDIVFNNGTRAVNIYGSKKSLRKLRREAIKCKITIQDNSVPF